MPQSICDGEVHQLTLREQASGYIPYGFPLQFSLAEQKRSTKPKKQTATLPTTPETPVETPSVRGFVEAFEHGKLHGWVFDATLPDESLAIQIYTNDLLLAEGMTDIQRDDLKEVGFGNSLHGFEFTLDTQTLKVGMAYPLRIALKGGAEVAINPFELSMTETLPAELPNETKQVISVRGCIDAFEQGKLIGWVFDATLPDESLAIQIYTGDFLLAEGVADIQRDDLKEVGFGNGQHGFELELQVPFLLSDKRCVIKIKLEKNITISSNTFKTRLLNPLFDSVYVAKQLNCPEEDALEQYLKALKNNPRLSCHILFDSDFYQKQLRYYDLLIDEPLFFHYISKGWKQGLDPHPLFDSEYYRNVLGLSCFEMCPLEFYLKYKNRFLQDTTPFLDEKYYNHCLNLDGEKISIHSPLHDLVVREKWQPFHREIHQQSIGPLVADTHLLDIIDRDKNIKIQDFINTIKALRSVAFEKKKTKLSGSPKNIKLSVIILNFNKLVHTILSTYSAHLALKNISHELIVVDNGSEFFCYKNIARYLNNLPHCRVLRLERNRFFGEGNNIALDQAKGEYIAFLNNDAYVNASTFDKLIKAFGTHENIGATGPVFILPNYELQEFGGKVSGCGQVIQIGKHEKLSRELVQRFSMSPGYVDYCSAACSVIKRSVLEQVGGFDYIFEPFYYEDTDLFSRIRCAGYQLFIEQDAHVMHFENTSTKSYLKDDFHSLIATNRRKFATRWFGKLEQGSALADKTPRIKLFRSSEKTVPKTQQRAFVYSPFPLGPGGGEKYILTLAVALSENYQTTIIFPEIYSTHRLKMVADDLGIFAEDLQLLTWHEALKQNRPDVFVVMANEIIPPVPAIGRRNFYHCQFPFPLEYTARPDGLATLMDYEGFIVNSQFTQRNIRSQLKLYGLPDLPVHIVYPPCWDGNVADRLKHLQKTKPNKSPKTLSIVNIGRFFQHGHNKRQDVVLEIIKQLKNDPQGKNWQITGTLLGGLSKSEEAYYKKLLVLADKLDVTMAANVERAEIEAAYQSADIYIHAAGFGKQEGYSPHELEHFGITPVEAMIHGVIPLVYAAGGPLEVINKVGVGESFVDVDEAVEKVWKLMAMSDKARREAQEKMILGCEEFGVVRFKERVRECLSVDCN